MIELEIGIKFEFLTIKSKVTATNRYPILIKKSFMKIVNNFWKILKGTYQDWSARDLGTEAASLAYSAIFSIPGLLYYRYLDYRNFLWRGSGTRRNH